MLDLCYGCFWLLGARRGEEDSLVGSSRVEKIKRKKGREREREKDKGERNRELIGLYYFNEL